VYLGRARYKGKLKTVWMSPRSLSYRKDATLSSKSGAIRDLGEVSVPVDWESKIVHWDRGDGFPVGYTKGSLTGWKSDFLLTEPLEWLEGGSTRTPAP